MRDIVDNRKILLVNLNGLSAESSSLIGSSIVNNLWHAIREGRSSQDNPVSLFLDEFQHFVHSPISPETMLAEARSFGLSMHLAHQGLDQLAGRRQLEDAVMNNAVNKVVFQRGLKDARTFASEFGSPVTDDDMKKLGMYEFVARVATDKGLSPPMTGVTRAPIKPDYFGQKVRAASRAAYGKNAYEVEQEIQARRAMEVSEPAITVGDEELDDEI
jgi:type IV secretory pathway TraG/TraD family ATPase VirD4